VGGGAALEDANAAGKAGKPLTPQVNSLVLDVESQQWRRLIVVLGGFVFFILFKVTGHPGPRLQVMNVFVRLLLTAELKGGWHHKWRCHAATHTMPQHERPLHSTH